MNRFSKSNFNKYNSSIEAVKKLLVEIGVDIQDQKQIELINKFFNIEIFRLKGEGGFAKVYQINDKEVLRISHSLPQPLPNDPHVNQRSGFLKINGYYLEKFPLLSNNFEILDLKPVRKKLRKQYPEIHDLHEQNFGKDPETGKIKVLDPGTFVPHEKEQDLLGESKFMELQHKYKNLLDAVKDNAYNITFIPAEYQTREICLEAVKKNGYYLRYIANQTPEICLAAVKQAGRALEYVENQTPEICMAAVKKDGLALWRVKNQTYEICLAAVKQNKNAIFDIRDNQILNQVKKELGITANRFNKENLKVIS